MAPTGAPSQHKQVVEQGVALNLREWEGPGDVTALLIHGTAEAGFVWDDFAPQLAQYCKVMTVDLRGHGESDHDPTGSYDIDKFGRDISMLVKDRGLNDLVLVGHSLGGDVAVKVAPRLGGRLRGLVIVDSGPGGDDETAKYLQDQLRESHRAYAGVEEYAQWLKDRRFLAQPAVLDRLAAASLALGADGLYRPRYDVEVLNLITSDNDDSWWLPHVSSVLAPVLVVRGMASASLSKQKAEQVRAAARAGQLVTVPAAGHAVMNDNIDGFAQAVLPFIHRIVSTKSASAG